MISNTNMIVKSLRMISNSLENGFETKNYNIKLNMISFMDLMLIHLRNLKKSIIIEKEYKDQKMKSLAIQCNQIRIHWILLMALIPNLKE